MSSALDRIKELYYRASKSSIVRDLDEAIDLLKSMPSEEERERAAVYMDGLAQMKAQWVPRARAPDGRRVTTGRRPGAEKHRHRPRR